MDTSIPPQQRAGQGRAQAPAQERNSRIRPTDGTGTTNNNKAQDHDRIRPNKPPSNITNNKAQDPTDVVEPPPGIILVDANARGNDGETSDREGRIRHDYYYREGGGVGVGHNTVQDPYDNSRVPLLPVVPGVSNMNNGMVAMFALLGMIITTLALVYYLNQRRVFPKRVSRVVNKVLFWPLMPLTFVNRGVFGTWITVVDDTVVLGAVPIGFARIPEMLRNKKEFQCTGVINMCDEYRGPLRQYQTLGMTQLWLPNVDHYEPSFEDYKEAVAFILGHEKAGERVYVHCKAGHGRSAAVVFAWLLYKNCHQNHQNQDQKQKQHPDNKKKAVTVEVEVAVEPRILNQQLCRKRNVRRTLWKQPNLKKFHSWLIKEGGRIPVPAIGISSVKRGGNTTTGTSRDNNIITQPSIISSKPKDASAPSSLEMTSVSSAEQRGNNLI